jgi:hypothetical protein
MADEPAKDETKLLDQVALATCECQPGGCYLRDGAILCCAEDDKVDAVFAAIRAAGWAVVPVEPTESPDAICGCDGYFDEGCPACTPGVKP